MTVLWISESLRIILNRHRYDYYVNIYFNFQLETYLWKARDGKKPKKTNGYHYSGN